MTTEARFLSTIAALTSDAEFPAKLLALHERAAFLEVDDGSVAVIIWPSLQGPELREAIEELLRRDRVTHLKLVLLGGGDAARDVLVSSRDARWTRRHIQRIHVGEDGKRWSPRSRVLDTPFARALDRALASPHVTDPGLRSTLLRACPPPLTGEDRARAVEHIQFIDRFHAVRPFVTYALVGWLALVFGLQMLWGGDAIATLMRMGANHPGALTDEPWRLLASASLHAGLFHFGVNAFVLLLLGRFFERVLGSPQLLVLYVAAALGGAVASAISGLEREALLSVGASGAVWGMLGAAAALAWRPRDILPRNLVGPMRRTVVINLVINSAVSFLPQVDLWAHLGGGLVGAALVGLGIVVPPPEGSSQTHLDRLRRRWWWGAGSAALLLVGSMAVALSMGKPWQLRTIADTSDRHELRVAQHTIALQLPGHLGPFRLTEDDIADEARPADTTYAAGEILTDGIEIGLRLVPLGVSTQEIELRLAEIFAQDEAAAPDGWSRAGPRTKIDPDFGYEERFVAPNGLRWTIRTVYTPELRVDLEVLSFPEFFTDEHIQNVTGSLELLAGVDSPSDAP